MKDQSITRVLFLKDKDDGDIFAYFPDDIADDSGNKSCYAHVGQHSACSPEYAKECRQATPEEYADLKAELEDYGSVDDQPYKNLKVLNKSAKKAPVVSGAGNPTVKEAVKKNKPVSTKALIEKVEKITGKKIVFEENKKSPAPEKPVKKSIPTKVFVEKLEKLSGKKVKFAATQSTSKKKLNKLNETWWSDSNGYVEIQIPKKVAEMCAHSGDNEPAIKQALQIPVIKKQFDKLDNEEIIKVIKEYGLSDYNYSDPEVNKIYLLWLACWDIMEGNN